MTPTRPVTRGTMHDLLLRTVVALAALTLAPAGGAAPQDPPDEDEVREAVAAQWAAGDVQAAAAAHRELCRRLEASGERATAAHEWVLLATLLADHGLVDESVAAVESYAELPATPRTDLAQALFELGQALSDSGESVGDEAACDAYARCIAMLRQLHPEGHPTIGTALNNLGLAHYVLGRPAEAEAAYLAAIEEDASRPPHSRAGTWQNLALCYESLGRIDDAIRAYERAIDLCLESAPEAFVVYLSTSDLASLLRKLGKDDEAVETWRRVVAARRAILPRGRERLESMEWDLATLLRDLHRPLDALEVCLEVYEREPDPGNELARMGIIACLIDMGRHAESEPYLRDWLADTVREGHEGGQETWIIRLMLSRCLDQQGRIDEGEALKSELFRELEEGGVGFDSPLVLALLASLRTISDEECRRLEEWVAAEEARGEAPTTSHLDLLALMGLVFEKLGRVEDGAVYLERAVELGRELGDFRQHVRVAALARVQRKLGNLGESEALFREAIDQVESIRASMLSMGEMDRSRYFAALRDSSPYRGMVWTQLELGRAELALEFAELGRGRSLLDLLNRSNYDPMEEVRRSAALRGDAELVERATELERELVDSTADIGRRVFEFEALRQRTDLEEATRAGLLDDVDELLRRTRQRRVDLERERAALVGRYVDFGTPASLAQMRALTRPGELALLYCLSPDRCEVLAWSADSPVRSYDLGAGSGDLEGRVDTCLSAIRARPTLAGRGLRPRASEAPPALDAGLFRVLVPDALWSELREASMVYLIPDGCLFDLPFEALVVRQGADGAPRFWLDDGPSVVYGVSASVLLRCRRLADEVGALDLPYEVVALGDPDFARSGSLELPGTGALVVEVAPESAGARAGLRPLDVILTYDGRSVANDGALRDEIARVRTEVEDEGRAGAPVKIEALRGGETFSVEAAVGPLGLKTGRGHAREAWEAGFGRDVAMIARARERSASLLGIRDLRPLPGTRREVERIAATLAGAGGAARVQTLLGPEATEANLFEWAPRGRYLHLASHHVVDETSTTSFSALALSSPAAASALDDGLLTLDDLLTKWRGRLRGCEMAVLSACETRRGTAQNDEGIVAMPWGLLFAGVPTIVVSQWRVDDDSTALLMSRFYEELAATEGRGKLRAFTKARSALRAMYPDPWFWAPFVMMGDPR